MRKILMKLKRLVHNTVSFMWKAIQYLHAEDSDEIEKIG